MKTITFLALSLLISATTWAQDVRPGEKLGSLQVEAPDLSFFDQTTRNQFGKGQLIITFKINTANKQIELGKTYPIAKGSGCLRIRYSGKTTYDHELCGIVIEEKKLTHMKLGAFQLTWNKLRLHADMGEKPILRLDDATSLAQIDSISPYGEASENLLYVLPAGKYKTRFSSSKLKFDERSEFALIEMEQKKQDITPPEGRAIISVEFQNTPAKFALIRNNFVVLNYRTRPFPSRSVRVTSRRSTYWRTGSEGVRNGKGREGIENYYSFLPKQKNHEVYVFPFAEKTGGPVFELVANETFLLLKPRPGEKLVVPIATVNVHHYDTGRSGIYQLFRHGRDSSGNISKFELKEALAGNNQYISNTERPTRTSINLIGGHEFSFEFYYYDHLGVRTHQDTEILDLR